MTTAPINAPQPDGRNAVGIESSAGFGTSDYRSPNWRGMEAAAKPGDRFEGTRKSGATSRATFRLRGFDGWVETDAGESWRFEYFCTICRDVHPLPNLQ